MLTSESLWEENAAFFRRSFFILQKWTSRRSHSLSWWLSRPAVARGGLHLQCVSCRWAASTLPLPVRRCDDVIKHTQFTTIDKTEEKHAFCPVHSGWNLNACKLQPPPECWVPVGQYGMSAARLQHWALQGNLWTRKQRNHHHHVVAHQQLQGEPRLFIIWGQTLTDIKAKDFTPASTQLLTYLRKGHWILFFATIVTYLNHCFYISF